MSGGPTSGPPQVDIPVRMCLDPLPSDSVVMDTVVVDTVAMDTVAIDTSSDCLQSQPFTYCLDSTADILHQKLMSECDDTLSLDKSLATTDNMAEELLPTFVTTAMTTIDNGNKIGFEVDAVVGSNDSWEGSSPRQPLPRVADCELVAVRRVRRSNGEVRRLLLDDGLSGTKRQLRTDSCQRKAAFGFVRAKMRRSPLLRLRSVVRLRTGVLSGSARLTGVRRNLANSSRLD